MAKPVTKTCLLILPRTFYSFAKMFGNALRDLGYEVTEANEEYPENPLGKVMAKLDLEVARRITRRVINERFLAGKRYDLVVIIKGRGVGKQLVADLKAHAGKVVGYHFDALAYDRATERWAEGIDRVSTFDSRDAKAKGWPLVELFSAEAPPAEPQPIEIGFSAIMRNHSNRLAYLDAVVRALDIEPEDSFFYIFEQDVRSLAWNFLKQPRLYRRWRKHIHRTPLPYEEYRRVLATSDFTIDYAHDKQTGLTMRSFEALASGAKLITNNPHVTRSPHFDEAHRIVFRPGDDPATLQREVAARKGKRPAIRWRSVTDCLLEIIGEREPPQAV
ncbi:glycosyltransferase family protein [Alteriqipengyuania sp. 357]